VIDHEDKFLLLHSVLTLLMMSVLEMFRYIVLKFEMVGHFANSS